MPCAQARVGKAQSSKPKSGREKMVFIKMKVKMNKNVAWDGRHPTQPNAARLGREVIDPLRVDRRNQADGGWGGRNGPCRKTVAIGAAGPANWLD